MHTIIKALLAVFWLVLIPTASGAFLLRKKQQASPGEQFLFGWLFFFAAAELLTVPMLFLNVPLHVLTLAFATITVLAAAAGVSVIHRKARTGTHYPQRPQKWLRTASPFLFAALLLIALQVFVVVRYAHLDADDALYVAASTTAVQEDSIFQVNAYTGIPYRELPRRYVFSPFPIFLSVASQLCGRLHPAVMAHTVFPAVLLPACYLALHQLGKLWFPKEKDAQGIFLFLAAAACWFSAYSACSAGNFQLVRLWQGKAVLAAFQIPLLLYLSLTIVMEPHPRYPWRLYAMANLGACLLSSVGIIFAPLLMGLCTVIGAVRQKSLRRLAAGFACCLPSIVLGAAYILLIVLRGRGIL